MCCSKRGLYWLRESAVKHSGASCYRPYKGHGSCVYAHLGYSQAVGPSSSAALQARNSPLLISLKFKVDKLKCLGFVSQVSSSLLCLLLCVYIYTYVYLCVCGCVCVTEVPQHLTHPPAPALPQGVCPETDTDKQWSGNRGKASTETARDKRIAGGRTESTATAAEQEEKNDDYVHGDSERPRSVGLQTTGGKGLQHAAHHLQGKDRDGRRRKVISLTTSKQKTHRREMIKDISQTISTRNAKLFKKKKHTIL